jgi:hypothetical protein
MEGDYQNIISKNHILSMQVNLNFKLISYEIKAATGKLVRANSVGI